MLSAGAQRGSEGVQPAGHHRRWLRECLFKPQQPRQYACGVCFATGTGSSIALGFGAMLAMWRMLQRCGQHGEGMTRANAAAYPSEAQYAARCRQVSLMDDSGNTKDDLKLPTGTDDADKLAKDIKAEFDDGKELIVTVVSVRPVIPAGNPC